MTSVLGFNKKGSHSDKSLDKSSWKGFYDKIYEFEVHNRKKIPSDFCWYKWMESAFIVIARLHAFCVYQINNGTKTKSWGTIFKN